MKVEQIQAITEEMNQILPSHTKHLTLEVEDYLQHLTPDEVKFLEKTSERRQKEFSTSRFAIRSMLTEEEADASVLTTDEGAPLWPTGKIGSISHTKGICSVAISSKNNLQALGIDLETRNRVKEKIWRKIASEKEIRSAKKFSEETELTMQDAMEILFSAKEATYKFQFPQTKTWIGFLEAEIEFDAQTQRIGISMCDPNHQAFELCKKATLRYALTNEHILSVAYSNRFEN